MIPPVQLVASRTDNLGLESLDEDSYGMLMGVIHMTEPDGR